MSAHRPPHLASLEELDRFDMVIDVRSPAEYAQDHVPGAINLPVLDDAQRAQVGTIYAQSSPFAARKLGAALVARNIAGHLEQSLADRPRTWKPLVYCWRGGQRSGAMTLVLNQVGWAARQLEGGYRAYRRQVLADLSTLPGRLCFVVLHGPTGSGKSALLEALGATGEQVLHLEELARHRGSVLGGHGAGEDQPGQKAFESLVWDGLRRCDPARPVYVESESRRIGRLGIPPALFDALIDARCIRVAATLGAREAHLLERYADVYGDRGELLRRLEYFVPLYGHKVVGQWRAWVGEGNFGALARAMVQTHYDPAYLRGGDALYRRARDAKVLELDSLGADALSRAVEQIRRLTGPADAQ